MYMLFGGFFYFISFGGFVLSLVFLNSGSVILDFMLPLSFSCFDLSFSFLFDWVSCLFFSVVCVISGGVYFYSNYYMGFKPCYHSNTNQFFYILFFFVFSMFFLVFSFSWITTMLGWDGLGVVSFLLVIYYNNTSSLDSGLVTIFMNRFGDCCFILSFMGFFYLGGFSLEVFTVGVSFFILFFLLLGSITKSAQIPFSSWLPLAMAAPTPVSSLVHSSTLVTAGVYLLIRFNYLFVDLYFILSVFSLVTMFIGGICALLEKDFKKVVAMSTLSQLGFMIFSISQGFWVLGYFHMVFHAFFKSMLFLTTGGLMHNLLGGQDSRLFGGFVSPYGRVVFNMSVLSLCGFPFSMGFYSKDTIVCLLLGESFSLLSLLFFVSCVFTVSYSVRMIYMAYYLFPSFSPSMGEGDEVIFFLPVLLIYLVSVFLGNYYFLNFFFISSFFSFFDYFLGLIIISLGVFLFFCGFMTTHFFLVVFSFSFFLSIISTKMLSGFNKNNLFYTKEMKWGLFFSGEGVDFGLGETKKNLNHILSFNFSVVIVGIILVFYLLV